MTIAPRYLHALALGLCAVACSASSTTSAFSDAGTDTDAGGAPNASDAAADSPTLASDAPVLVGDAQSGCTGAAAMTITDFVSNGACYYDTSLQTGSTGTLIYDCNGGAAKLTVGPEVFTGTYDAKSGTISLQEQRNFPFSDGCTWTSVQTITGDLAKGTFTYGYQEHVASGTGCATPCEASASMTASVTPIPPPK